MTWRDGVHLTGTPIWCDARRRRDVCFVSSAERIGRTGHGQLIGTSLTLALLGHAGTKIAGHLAVPLHRRFTLGTLRLELIASGRGPGAAALHVDIAGRGVLYAGTVRPLARAVATLEEAEVRACQAVVVAAPYGEPHHRFPPLGETVEATVAWVRDQLAQDRHAVLLVDGVLDALEVARVLLAAGIAVSAARGIREAARRAGDSGLALAIDSAPVARRAATAPGARRSSPDLDRAPAPRPPASIRELHRAGVTGVPALPELSPSDTARMLTADLETAAAARPSSAEIVVPGELARPSRGPTAKPPAQVIVWLDEDREGLARALGDRSRAIALVSGRAIDGAGRELEASLPWTNAADRAQLLAWIESSSAREVFVTGRCAETIVAALGDKARVVGPPHQMPLFPGGEVAR